MARNSASEAIGIEMTAWDYGYNYGSFLCSKNEHTQTVNLRQRPLPNIPVEDYREMRDSGIEPNTLEYWKGFNQSLSD